MDLSHAFSVDMSNLVEMQEGFYWIVLDIALGFCVLWMLLCFMIIEKIDIRLERLSI
jgi:hypothetical protein